jgi:small GTP-binding protein
MSSPVKRKICMLGAFSVGKTSLVARFVKSMFSDKYLTTVGVKIDKKEITADGKSVTLLIWDMAGEDDVQKANLTYLRGAAGYLLVADGTRRETLEVAGELHRRVETALGTLPFVVMLNKSDLAETWEAGEEDLSSLTAKGWRVVRTSAKTGEGVEEAFQALALDIAGG